MIILNIIPENLKKELKFRQFYQSFKTFLASMLLAMILYSIGMLAAIYILQQHFVETINKANIITKSSENSTNTVKNINSQINSIESIQTGFVKWSSLIKHLADSTDQDVRLTQLTLNRESSSIYMTGVAKTRDSLLKLKDTLESSENFSNVEFPIKNLLEKTNIKFDISAKIASYEF